jgi:DNA-binding transcriptional ArsR family regulator/2-polyprenyl-3-methyl-5-hydroxy-6-metoxy-1,4-benzoquinol methylase
MPQAEALLHSIDPLASSALGELAQVLKAVADKLRLQILQLLADDSFGVLELAGLMGLAQPALSHHLKVLQTAGLVTRRREGNSIFYRRALLAPDDPACELKRCLFTQLDHLPLPAALADARERCWQTRAQASAAFFRDNITQFAKQQDLIACYPSYAEGLQELLRISLRSLPNQQLALEVGPGEGEFLTVLAREFEQVVAIDLDPQLLAIAQKRNAAFTNITYRCQDALAADPTEACALIALNMVLHHIPSPAALIKSLSSRLAPGGVLLLTDLCRHQQAWAQTACGDLWLGFDAADLNHWAALADLQVTQSSYIGLRNGFQIQIVQCVKSTPVF